MNKPVMARPESYSVMVDNLLLRGTEGKSMYRRFGGETSEVFPGLWVHVDTMTKYALENTRCCNAVPSYQSRQIGSESPSKLVIRDTQPVEKWGRLPLNIESPHKSASSGRG